MIEVKNISKTFGDNQVLKNVSTIFEKGKTNLIIGQSGSGKTVMMKSCIGLINPDEGEILFDQRPFSRLAEKKKKEIRKDMGVLFQGGALFDSFNVEQKLDRVNFVLKRVNLENVNKLYPSEISGGMMKRVAIARAISNNPQYLFCDEPNSGLDPKTAEVIDALISEITEEYDMTTVINTHDMNSVLQIGQRISFLYKGQLWWQGDMHTILEEENPELQEFVFSTELTRRIKK